MGKQSSSRVTKKKKVNLIKKKMERDRKVRKAAKKGIALPRNSKLFSSRFKLLIPM